MSHSHGAQPAGAHSHAHGAVDEHRPLLVKTGGTPPVPATGFAGALDRFFHITERGSTIKTEVRAGFVTFVTMSYILLVNPQVLTVAGYAPSGGGEFPFPSLVTATALSAALGSILVALIGNLPFGLAPGMGLNSYFAYGICIHYNLTWQIALTCVFIQGVLLVILAWTGVCQAIQRYAPPCIKKSITVGLGIFQALLGFEAMGFVVRGDHVLLALGRVTDARIWLALVGVIIIAILMIMEVRAAMLVGVVFVTATAWATGLAPTPQAVVMTPSLDQTFWRLDFQGYWDHARQTVPCTMVFLFVVVFDAAGVMYAAGQKAGLLDETHTLPTATQGFLSAGFSTIVGSLLGTSPVIVANESCAGIHDGGRTGLTALVVGICFLIGLPFAPLLQAMPAVASAPPLVIVGVLMMACAKFIDWEQLDEAVPAFMVVTVLPFTYSIANGMLFGLGTWVMIKLGAAASAQILQRNVISVPVLQAGEAGIVDAVPGLPSTHYYYHDPVKKDDDHSPPGAPLAPLSAAQRRNSNGAAHADAAALAASGHDTTARMPFVRPRTGVKYVPLGPSFGW